MKLVKKEVWETYPRSATRLWRGKRRRASRLVLTITMSTSLDDIWDEPALPATPRRRSTSPDEEEEDDSGALASRPAKRRKSSSLFLPASDDDEDDGAPADKRAKRPTRSDIDKMFEDVEKNDDEGDGVPPTPGNDGRHRVLPSSSPARDVEKDAADGKDGKKGGQKDDGEGGKQRKKPLRLDENRLLGDEGFPVLIKNVKGFKPKGKGHEARVTS